MSVDFYPRKPQEWITHRSRYPFQSGVASLDGPDRTRDFGSAAASAAFYGYQKAKMKRVSPHLLQDGFDLSYDEAIKRAVLQDPVGLDFRLPSEMQEFLDSHAAVNANPQSAAWTTHPTHALRMQPPKRAATGTALGAATPDPPNDDFESPPLARPPPALEEGTKPETLAVTDETDSPGFYYYGGKAAEEAMKASLSGWLDHEVKGIKKPHHGMGKKSFP